MLSSPLLNNNRRDTIWLTVMLFVFGTIYSLISFVNHYEFRTAGLDLGMFNNALYCFSHLRPNYVTLDCIGRNMNYFGDHFSPLTPLYSPLYYVFGSYTLLIIQIVSILAGGIGVYKYAKLKFPSGYLPLLIIFQFYTLWGIYSALAFDFHSNVVAAMLVPFLLYYYELADKKRFLIFFFIILFCKENMAIWLVFIIGGLMLKKGFKKNLRQYMRFEIPLAVFSCIYFFVVVNYVMPPLQNSTVNLQLGRFDALGITPAEILTNVLKDPIKPFTLLFESDQRDPIFYGIKSETHFVVLLSGGLALLYRPYYLFMLIPIYMQKFLSNESSCWGITGQYSIEFAPLLSLAIIDSLIRIPKPKTRYIIAGLLAFSTLYINYSTLDHRRSIWYDPVKHQFYSACHYQTKFNLPEIYEALKLIPDGVPVSACSNLAPHLANREKLYGYPIIKDAEYIALLTDNTATWPMPADDYAKAIDALRTSADYSVVYDKNMLLIVKKK